ncbi:MAG: hypothetical protein ACP5HZ_12180, partial [Ferrimicrobium sp.]
MNKEQPPPTRSLVTIADLVQPHERSDSEDHEAEPKRTVRQRLSYYSPLRIVLGLLLLAALGYGATRQVKSVIANS